MHGRVWLVCLLFLSLHAQATVQPQEANSYVFTLDALRKAAG
jgi:hypothetical protein